MSLIDVILRGVSNVFGGDRDSITYGKLDPNNVEHYWAAVWDLEEAARSEESGRHGSSATALAGWGFKSMKEWERAKLALFARHQGRPDFQAVGARVSAHRGVADAMRTRSLARRDAGTAR
ncbi:MAG: hypothetical protein ACHREM_01865 [Polyangiales bacterium]